jgi:hypothetical protein
MTAFIDEHREMYGVEPICRTLQFAPSTYYDRRAIVRDPDLASARAKSDATLSLKIDAAWDANRKLYGAWNRPGSTGGQNSRRIARYGTDIKEEDLEAVFT